MRESTAHEADMRDERARSHFRLGSEMYNLGRYQEAAQEFQTAYDLSRRPELLYNVYLAQRDAQHPREAGAALRQYLAEVSNIPNRAQLEARLASYDEAERQRAAEEAERAAAATELERQRAEAEAAAEEARRQAAEAERGRLRAVNAVRTRPWWPWLLTGAGVLMVGGGILIDVDAGTQANALRAQCQPAVAGRLQCNSSLGARATGERIANQALLGDVLWIAGAALAITGTILAFSLNDDVAVERAETPHVQPEMACAATGCMVGARGNF